MRTSPLRLAATAGVGAVLCLGVVACSSDGSSSDSSSTSPTTMASGAGSSSATTMPSSSGSLTQANFGPGCAAVPTTGSGSFSGMAADPAATAASNNPALSTLVTAVKAAGLVDTLNGSGPFTVFAPTNDAFAKIPAATLNGVLADPKGALSKVLTYHVIPGKSMNAQQLADAGKVTTVEGQDLTITKSGSTIQINGQSAVVCGNVKVGNGTVQIIDTVLMPPAS